MCTKIDVPLASNLTSFLECGSRSRRSSIRWRSRWEMPREQNTRVRCLLIYLHHRDCQEDQHLLREKGAGRNKKYDNFAASAWAKYEIPVQALLVHIPFCRKIGLRLSLRCNHSSGILFLLDRSKNIRWPAYRCFAFKGLYTTWEASMKVSTRKRGHAGLSDHRCLFFLSLFSFAFFLGHLTTWFVSSSLEFTVFCTYCSADKLKTTE